MSGSTNRHRTVDAHLHLVDFAQRTEGLPAMISAMDVADVEHTVVFGLPVCKEWPEWDEQVPGYYLEDNSRCYYYSFTDAIVVTQYRALPESDQARITPLLCGFSPVDRNAVKQIEQVLKLFPDVFRGFGEILCRHDDLTNLTYGQPARVNHPALSSVFDFAAERDWPVLIHQNLTSAGRPDEMTFKGELDDVLRNHPRTRFVLAHCGTSRRLKDGRVRETIDDLLSSKENLFVDYSWVVFEKEICRDDAVDEEWLALTERHHRRICLGSDLIGKFSNLSETMARYDPFLESLSAEARAYVTVETALEIYR